MDFRTAFNTAAAELTPQPWEWTDPAGTTLTVIPAGLRADPGCAEATVRITASRLLAAEVGITTAALPGLLASLEACTAWEYTATVGDQMTVAYDSGGALLVRVRQVDDEHGRAVYSEAVVRLPAGQRLPLASALHRALDVARGWED